MATDDKLLTALIQEYLQRIDKTLGQVFQRKTKAVS